MGMDVFGKNPTDEVGRYFRNNIWWWHPLATFLTETYPDLTAACTHWQSNDGDGLDADDASTLATALQRDLDTGVVARYAEQREEALAALPMHECDLCDGTGVRTDEVGRAYGYDKPRDTRTGAGGCNGCDGTGKVAPWITNYPFSVENVADFADFLRSCGGFQIC